MKPRTLAECLKDYCLRTSVTDGDCARKLGVEYETLYKWVHGHNFPRRAQWQRLIDHLGLSMTDMIAMYNHRKGVATEYSAKSLRDLFSSGMTAEEINVEFEKILDNFPLPPCEGNSMGSRDKWSRAYSLSPHTGYALIYKGKDIVGYWFFVPVRPEVYERILEGENVNEELRVEDIIGFFEPGEYDIYFVDFFILQEHRHHSARKRIFSKLTELMESLAGEGFFFRRISANITEDEAKSLCTNRGFTHVANHKYHRIYRRDESGRLTEDVVPSEIWEVRLAECLDGHFFGNNESLRELYRSHFA